MNKLQEYILEILTEIDRICRLNGIPYALAYGSALGVANFKGFIPWDTDADVVISLDDLYRFRLAVEKDLDTGKFVFDNHDMFIPMKIRRKGTHVREGFISETFVEKGDEDGVYVDVQPFINVSDDYDRYVSIMRKICYDHVIPRHMVRCLFHGHIGSDERNRLRTLELNYHRENIDSGFVNQTILTAVQYHSQKHRKPLPRDVIFPFKDCEFEGHIFQTFNDVERFCLLTYGDRCLNPDEYPQRQRKKSRGKVRLIKSKR